MTEIKSEVTTHFRIAKLCQEMAWACYEESASRNNDFYAIFPDPIAYVREVAPTLREEAKRILAGMLNDKNVSTKDKEEIYEALLLDATIPPTPMWTVPKSKLEIN